MFPFDFLFRKKFFKIKLDIDAVGIIVNLKEICYFC